jgi:Flp pilus assembly pilin Flp
MPSTLLAIVRCLIGSRRGATAIEYSLIIACGRRLLADRRGTALIGYSSIMLLVAIAAIAMLSDRSILLSGARQPVDTTVPAT